MDIKKNTEKLSLEFRTFGHFSLSGAGEALDAGSIRSEMIMRLLAYILCHRNKTLGIQELTEILWPEDESDNPAGALKNLMYRLRVILKKTWGNTEFILTGKGSYQWNPLVQVNVDSEEFDDLCKRADKSEKTADIIENGKKAITFYTGPFLPELDGEYWVVTLAAYYHSVYLTMVKKLAGSLEELKEYGKIEEICLAALQIDALDEVIHCYLIRALIKENKQKLAIDHYRETTRLLYDSLGVRPSDEMRGLYDELMKQQHFEEEDISNIEKELQGEEESGAFQCEFGVFQKMYAQQARSSERLGLSVHLVLMTLMPLAPIDRGSEPCQKLIGRGMALMQTVLQNSLRSADIFCRYSENQYLIMLPACQYENALMVIERLENNYDSSSHKARVRIQYSVDEVANF